MGTTSQSLLHGQRLSASGFIEIEPLNQDVDGWWNISFHHVDSGKVQFVPGITRPVIETEPIAVSGRMHEGIGAIMLCFSMINQASASEIKEAHEGLFGAGDKEFDRPHVGGNTEGVNVFQEFNGKLIKAEYLERPRTLRVIADSSTESRGISPFIKIAQSVGAIGTYFNDDLLVGLIHIAKDLTRIEPES